MDTLTHALSGALIGRALVGSRNSRVALPQRWFGPPLTVAQSVAVGATAATFPDVDFVLSWVSDLTYLRGHRGVTHSLPLWPLWSVLLGLIMAQLFRRRELWKRASWIAAAGIGMHIAGDWITQFGTMLLAPFSDARFGLGSSSPAPTPISFAASRHRTNRSTARSGRPVSSFRQVPMRHWCTPPGRIRSSSSFAGSPNFRRSTASSAAPTATASGSTTCGS
jgi:membrane-bound metal-dependent hydrolase YbcI (DUF457 family)